MAQTARHLRKPPTAAPQDTRSHAELVANLERDCDAARAADAAKSRYLANVSHEIRAPLNIIYGYAQLIERRSGVDPREAAKVILRSTEHLIDLVEGLLDISLVENGVTRVARDVVRLPAFLDQLVRMFEPDARAKGLAFHYEAPQGLPEFVRTDQKRLRQVLINLLGNAIKFTDRGRVVLRVVHSGEVARFEVEDSGPGISAEERERIFSPFERGVAQAGSTNGFGLGLPITRAIVHILGGDLDLVSTPGAGSCFRVRMMLPKVWVPGDTGPRPGRITGYTGRRRTILVVDDDLQQLAFVRQALNDVGFEVAVAPGGETALALCNGQRFDLVLLDVQMPGCSGWETAARLRDRFADAVRIVMLSANAHERHGPDGQAASDAAAPHDLFLVKPVEIGRLIDAIGQELGLEWEREDIAPTLQRRAPATALPPAAQPHVERLREFLRIGHARAIAGEIAALERAAPEAGDLIARLYARLDRFDMAGLARMLDEY
ncbi:ATP-binding protein [Novosphingobium sp. SG720]|uniref:ATP-binding response regulator n=1 Tax=Novosphingobium sp. SG720 TaxID=2586998 RepID=UPI001444C486|nr:ATP-binding protein [Novosphingobium sp. SG720]NKJ42123.1 CheY-like chemotaxis protein/anti-sigma regulatory factor (Ser/Thr protein kinase) [Novosphingobium sp. SG720]